MVSSNLFPNLVVLSNFYELGEEGWYASFCCLFLASPRCMQDLSSLTRERTCGLCIGSTES